MLQDMGPIYPALEGRISKSGKIIKFLFFSFLLFLSLLSDYFNSFLRSLSLNHL